MLYCSFNLLQVVQETIDIWKFIEFLLILFALVGFIWGIFKGFATKASKSSLQELSIKVEDKVCKKDFENHKMMFEQFRLRHEQHNSEIQRLFYKKVDDLDQKFDKKFDNLKDDIIEILQKK